MANQLGAFQGFNKKQKKSFLKQKPGNKVSLSQFRNLSNKRKRKVVRRGFRQPKIEVQAGGSPAPEFIDEGVGGGPGSPGGGGGGGGIAGVPPPTLPSTEAARNTARTQFDVTSAKADRDLFDAAMRLGDPNILARFSKFGPAVVSPNSEFATIDREQGLARTNLGETANQGNTFFSGLHLRDLGRLADEASRGRLAATDRFTGAQTQASQILAQALADRDQALAEADALDLEALFAEDPPPAPGKKKDDKKGKKGKGKKGKKGKGKGKK